MTDLHPRDVEGLDALHIIEAFSRSDGKEASAIAQLYRGSIEQLDRLVFALAANAGNLLLLLNDLERRDAALDALRRMWLREPPSAEGWNIKRD
jgi:hypothetical protein